MGSMATVREIAALAGVSPATVSRVLSMDKSFSVSDETRAKVFAVADELQYRGSGKAPRYTARVALVMLHSEADELQDPYYLNIRFHIRRAAEAERIRLTETFCEEFPEGNSFFSGCAGILVLGETARWTPEWEKAVAQAGVPAVLVDFCAEGKKLDCVYADPRQIVELAMGAFEKNGTDRVGYIGEAGETGPDGKPEPDQRQIFFAQYQKVRDRFRPEDIFTAPGATFESGYQIAKEILRKEDVPNAFFVMNDSMAIGASRAFSEAGVRIPEDVELIGCNNIASAAYHIPPLTTIDLHTNLIGELSLRMLRDRIENGRQGDVGVRVIVPGELIERNSTRSGR